MRIVAAMDSFKGSITSLEAGEAVRNGILEVSKDIEVDIIPIADGGEGTVDALVKGLHGVIRKINVSGPLGDIITASYGITGKTAVIEMASAAGLTLVPNHLRNPLNTTTYGVGEMILDAADNGCDRFLIGIGGSATNDCGIGMLQAIGVEFLDNEGNSVCRGAKGIKNISQIDSSKIPDKIRNSFFRIACDVNNPLYGEKGCSYVFSPQKGADSDMAASMEEWIKKYSAIVSEHTGKDYSKMPGAGAAGGLGYAFCSFLNAELKSGIDIIIEETHLEEHIKGAALVITGEGKIDAQTFMGKAPAGVAKLAFKHNVPAILIGGCVDNNLTIPADSGVTGAFSILNRPMETSQAMEKNTAMENLSETVRNIIRFMKKIKE